MARVLRGRPGQYNDRGALASTREVNRAIHAVTNALYDIYVPKPQPGPVQVLGAEACLLQLLGGV